MLWIKLIKLYYYEDDIERLGKRVRNRTDDLRCVLLYHQRVCNSRCYAEELTLAAMLNGFEEITATLSVKEKEVVLPIIAYGLRQKVGRHRAVTNKAIIDGLKKNCGMVVSAPRVRKIVNFIRMNNIVPCLIATSDGYYIAESEEELLDYEASLQGRLDAIQGVLASIRQQRIAKYN